jgi:Zn finger protein HypA/HybF involved in hydrogenase expression
MTSCRHDKLLLLPEDHQRLRCRHCHLTLKAEALQGGHCPECLATTGKKHHDFETIRTPVNTRYRCEKCGAIIEYIPRR